MKPPGFSGSITTSTFSFSRRLRLAWAFLLNFVLYSEILVKSERFLNSRYKPDEEGDKKWQKQVWVWKRT
jgi:hypothetical protein